MMNSPRSAGRPGSGPETFSSHHLRRVAFPDRVLGAPGMRPAAEDRGHIPGDAELEMLDPPGLQAPAGRRIVEADPGRNTKATIAHLFDCLTSSGVFVSGRYTGHAKRGSRHPVESSPHGGARSRLTARYSGSSAGRIHDGISNPQP